MSRLVKLQLETCLRKCLGSIVVLNACFKCLSGINGFAASLTSISERHVGSDGICVCEDAVSGTGVAECGCGSVSVRGELYC